MSLTGYNFFKQASEINLLSAQLSKAIYLARTEAIGRQRKIILCGSCDQNTCSADWQNGFIIKTSDQVIYHFQNFFQKGILHWRSFSLDKTQLVFSPTGFLHSQNGTFWYCPKDWRKPAWALVLNQSGRVREVFPDSKGNVLDDKEKPLIC